MGTEAAFLADILADPDDDTPRLIYADWLDEHGRPERAEFIRLQVRLAGLGSYATCQKACEPPLFPGCPNGESRGREWELLEVYGYLWWLDTFGNTCGPPSERQLHDCFRRGFIKAIALPWADFLRHTEVLFRAAPICEVRLTDRRPNHASSAFHEELSWDWWEFDPWGRRSASAVGPELFDQLDGGTKDAGGRRYCEYPTEQAALDALSTACVKYGRAVAEKSLALVALP